MRFFFCANTVDIPIGYNKHNKMVCAVILTFNVGNSIVNARFKEESTEVDFFYSG